MGILDRLFGPTTKGSGGLFNQANQHWKLRQQALLAGDEDKQLRELLEVVRYCQLAIEASRKEGNAYVLLTNALLVASRDAPEDEDTTDILRKYAAGVIHKWWTLPKKDYPITKTKNYELGVQFYRQVLEKLQQTEDCSEEEAKAIMADYGGQYGDLATSSGSYERIKRAVVGSNTPPEAQEPERKSSGEEVIPFHTYVSVACIARLLQDSEQTTMQSGPGALVHPISGLYILARVLVTCVRAGLKHPTAIPMFVYPDDANMRRTFESNPDPDNKIGRVLQAIVEKQRGDEPTQGPLSLLGNMVQEIIDAVRYDSEHSTGSFPPGFPDLRLGFPLEWLSHISQACGFWGLVLASVEENSARSVIADSLSSQFNISWWPFNEEGDTEFTDYLLQSYQDEFHVELT